VVTSSPVSGAVTAATIFLDGLRIICSLVQDQATWLAASRTCRTWSVAARSCPARDFFEVSPSRFITESTAQSPSFRKHVHRLLVDASFPQLTLVLTNILTIRVSPSTIWTSAHMETMVRCCPSVTLLTFPPSCAVDHLDGLDQLRHLERMDLRGIVSSAMYLVEPGRLMKSIALCRQLTQLQLSKACSLVDQESCVVLLRSLTRLIDLRLATDTTKAGLSLVVRSTRPFEKLEVRWCRGRRFAVVRPRKLLDSTAAKFRGSPIEMEDSSHAAVAVRQHLCLPPPPPLPPTVAAPVNGVDLPAVAVTGVSLGASIFLDGLRLICSFLATDACFHAASQISRTWWRVRLSRVHLAWRRSPLVVFCS
jgi:hypothetical protein